MWRKNNVSAVVFLRQLNGRKTLCLLLTIILLQLVILYNSIDNKRTTVDIVGHISKRSYVTVKVDHQDVSLVHNLQKRRTTGSKKIKILLWDDGIKFYDKEKRMSLKRCGSNCIFTKKRDQLNESHVIVFAGESLTVTPPRRHRKHLWVFYSLRPPVYFVRNKTISKIINKSYRFAFNVTSTYSSRSDVPIPVPRFFWRKDFNHTEERTLRAKIKPKMAAWYANQCKTQSERERFVNYLARYLPGVDVYGKCGLWKCPQNNRTGCNDLFNSSYAFYLALEDDLCEGHISEAVWSVYENHIDSVPVVMGHANYKSNLPKNTFVNIADFSSGDISLTAERLAKHLTQLRKDPKEYNKMLMARKRFFYDSAATRKADYFCNLCDYLRSRKGVHHKPRDLKQTWSGLYAQEEMCLSPEQYYMRDKHSTRVLVSNSKETPLLGNGWEE